MLPGSEAKQLRCRKVRHKIKAGIFKDEKKSCGEREREKEKKGGKC